MNRAQRYRYQMFVRVRDFGAAHRELFPETSKGGQALVMVTAAAAAIAEYLTKRDLARADAQRVKATTRAAVWRRMKTIAHTARRAVATTGGPNPFKMPSRSSSAVVLARARAFVEQAEVWRDQFVELGLPPTFVGELQVLTDRLEHAVNVQLNSRATRRQAQAGIETAFLEGFDAIRTLDVVVANALLDDPVLFAGWQGARRVEGQRRSSSAVVTIPMPIPAIEPAPAAGESTGEREATETTHDALVPVPMPDELLRRAS